MINNSIYKLYQRKQPIINGWISIPNSFVAEIMSTQGWDSLTIDMQHGLVDYSTSIAMLQAISTNKIFPIARVPWLEEGIIMKTLDAGAKGIICPMINSRAEAQKLVNLCYYPPVGERSVGPIRALFQEGGDYLIKANENIIPFAMIETIKSVENIEEILSVEGLKAIYVGPSDLSISMGFEPKGDQEQPEVKECIKEILSKCNKFNILAGIHNISPEYAQNMIEWGYDFVTVSTDMRILVKGCQDFLKPFKKK